jgi:hypothetical protein
MWEASRRHLLRAFVALAALVLVAPLSAQTNDAPSRRKVDLVIALDVSGSMSGLIESTKQRLWDIVNELGRAQPTPELRVAILSYGNPAYGAQSGYVRLDLPFTSDLDAVNQTLFSFGTNGGDEYVARVIKTSLDGLQWSPQPESLRILFVAGNEAATQDPVQDLAQVAGVAVARDVVVNALYCGADSDGEAAGWQRVAALAKGFYASIDQSAAAVANVATPMDAPLAALNEELNATYLAYGGDAERYRSNQLAQDRNAAAMSAPAAASRAVAKASALYQAPWDLVDAVASGKALAEVAEAELPAEMRQMDADERARYVEAKSERRAEVQAQIAALDEQRRAYIAAQSRAAQGEDAKALDEAMLEALHAAAARKGFVFAGAGS